MKTVLATTSSFAKNNDELIGILHKNGYKLVKNPYCRKLTESELLVLLEENRPLGLLAGVEPITENALKQARNYLKIISRVGVGWDNIGSYSREARREMEEKAVENLLNGLRGGT